MKKQINDLLLKMQNGENCIGETANQLLDLFYVMRCSIVKHPIGMNCKENKKVTYCYQCGTNVKGQKYCHGCGRRLLWNNA